MSAKGTIKLSDVHPVVKAMRRHRHVKHVEYWDEENAEWDTVAVAGDGIPVPPHAHCILVKDVMACRLKQFGSEVEGLEMAREAPRTRRCESRKRKRDASRAESNSEDRQPGKRVRA